MGATTLEPGEETFVLLSLPMGMHEGMDGPHLFRIAVPVHNGSGADEQLELFFEADFG